MKDAILIILEGLLGIIKYLLKLIAITALILGTIILVQVLAAGLNQLSNYLNLNTKPMEV